MLAFAIAVLALVAAGFTFWPLFVASPVGSATQSRGSARIALSRRKEVLLENLADLEDERAMGKIDPEDYARLYGDLERRAAQAIDQLELLDRTRVRLAPEPEATRFCIHCGEGLPSRARFCPACGEAVG